jgi:hypothetical protein
LAASAVTLSPVLPIGPFGDALLALDFVAFDLVVFDEPFRLVDFLALDVRRERVLEERVVFAIGLAFLGLVAGRANRPDGWK